MKEIITGSKEMIQQLQQIDKKMANKISRDACRGAAKVIASAWKKDAPRKSGLTSRSVKVRAMKRKAGRVGVMAQIGAGDFKGETFYSSFVELGFKRGKRGSKNRKQVAGKHWMKKSFDSNKAKATETYIETMRKGVADAANPTSN